MKKGKEKLTIAIAFFAIGVLVTSSVVYAATLYTATEVSYDNSNSGTSKTNVQTALDELYEKTIRFTGDSNCENASAPVLKGALVPVTIADNGTVTYANTSSTWYNYCKKEWANAVILNSGYSYNVGDTIPESAIKAYFVWIPKYKYKLWNVGVTDTETAVHSIDIVFDTTNTTDTETSCATPMTSGGTGNCSNGKYMTHPAFISMDVNGFWVGKFELTGSIDSLTVKPNSVALTNQTVSSFFNAMYNFNRTLDSHMMKNTEWGAVAYLSHSKVGIDREVNINNNSAYKTGYSANLTTQQGIFPGEYGDGSAYNSAYNTTIGYLASTTGNISGIYDMSGGAHEYMASYRSGASIPSGDAKYFDVYSASSSTTTYNYRILGDATGEVGPFVTYKDGDGTSRLHNKWYGDDSLFIVSAIYWIDRGGHHDNGVLCGQFNFHSSNDDASIWIGSRLVLAPK